VTLALREQRIPWLYLAPLCFNPQNENCSKIQKKAPKGIDKIKIGFIIKDCGEKWGKRVNKDITDKINGA